MSKTRGDGNETQGLCGTSRGMRTEGFTDPDLSLTFIHSGNVEGTARVNGKVGKV